MFLTEKKELKFSALRDGITCAVYVRTASIDLSDFPLIINKNLYKAKLRLFDTVLTWIKYFSRFIAETILLC